MYSHIERGCLNTAGYTLFFRDEHGPISPMHDIPLVASEEKEIFNMIIEMPRWSNAKMETRSKERLNPIMQELQDGDLRYCPNVFPYHGIFCNYGAFPQTWENPDVRDESTERGGDGDPLDALEIGYKVGKVGEVRKVKILGTIALLDQGETDWKVFCIDVTDPMADSLKDVSDLDKQYSGLLDAAVNWFRVYKMNIGKPENKFAFDGKPKEKGFALQIIQQTHHEWEKLVTGKIKPTIRVNCLNTTVEDSPYRITYQQAEDIVSTSPLPGAPRSIDPAANNWFFHELVKRRKKNE